MLFSNFSKSPLNIAFIGGLRYFDVNKKVIRQFANSQDYVLSYIGKLHPGCDLIDYCSKYKITNVHFFPRYTNEEKPKIYRSVDFINSIYGSSSPEVRTALPNRLYDCALFKCPIIVSKGTYLAEVVGNYDLGFAVDVDHDDVKELLESYTAQYSEDDFMKGCEEFLCVAREEKRDALEKVDSFIRSVRLL